jgi:autotransporter-associated beta strand protein
MEARRMLSAAVAHRVLSIEGTGRSDTIVLTMDTPRTLRVRVGDVESTFLKKTFGKIRIVAGRGEDLVTVGSDANPIMLPVSVSAGDGSDTIIGGAGNDSISGGAGADQITGGAGDDSVTGDGGNDDLHGGDGRDSLKGGRGDDELHDDAGRDAVFGNGGTDLCYYHDDVKQFRDAAKAEQTYSEPTFQVMRGAAGDLVLNMCPLYAPDGTPITGGLVKAGGSTLVFAGNVLGQWGGDGLDVSHAYVPHFDLPGGSFVGSGSGSIGFISGSIGNVAVLNGFGGGSLVGNVSGSGSLTKSGSGTLTLNGSNTDTGSTTIDGGTLSLTNSPINVSTGSTLTTGDSGGLTTAAGTLTLSGVTINSNGNALAPIIGVMGNNATMPTLVGSTISLVGQTIPHFVVAPGGASIVPSGNVSGQWTGGGLGDSSGAVNHVESAGGLFVSGGTVNFGSISSYTGSTTLTSNAGLFGSVLINQSGTLGLLTTPGFGGTLILNGGGLILGSDPIMGGGRISPLLPLVNTSSIDIGPVIDGGTDGGSTAPTTGNDIPPAPTDVGGTPTGNIGAGDPPSGNDPAIVEETVAA